MVKYSLRAQVIFHRISQLESQYRHSQLQLQYCPSWESNVRRVDSPYCSGSWGYIFQYTTSSTGSVLKIYPFLYWEYIFQYTPSRAGPLLENITQFIEQY
jgi:hypothetical protein